VSFQDGGLKPEVEVTKETAVGALYQRAESESSGDLTCGAYSGLFQPPATRLDPPHDLSQNAPRINLICKQTQTQLDRCNRPLDANIKCLHDPARSRRLLDRVNTL